MEFFPESTDWFFHKASPAKISWDYFGFRRLRLLTSATTQMEKFCNNQTITNQRRKK